MIENLENELAQIGVRLLDDAHLAWLTAESECERALHAWFDGGGDRTHAYFAYRAALDREEAAAHDLQRLWQLSEPCRDALSEHEEQLGEKQ